MCLLGETGVIAQMACRHVNACMGASLFLLSYFGGLTGFTEAAETVPGDVFARVEILSTDLDRLRRHVGAPLISRLDVTIRDATPNDVYYQALTLFAKSDRLSFELRRHQDSPPPPLAEKRPADVLKVVEAAHEAILGVTDNLGLARRSVQPITDPNKTPSDVFMALMRVNRQLNLLLDRQFGPSEVFMQVTYAVGIRRQLAGRIDRSPARPGRA